MPRGIKNKGNSSIFLGFSIIICWTIFAKKSGKLDALVYTIPSKQSTPVLIKSETAQPRCSAWHEKYLNLIEQSKPASYLVAHPIGGLSDSLTGLVTSFLLAYVSEENFIYRTVLCFTR